MIEETYPSGRVVKNVLDHDGRLSLVRSRRADTGFWTYASAFSWTAIGSPSSLHLGNGHWESMQLNTRFQPTQIGLGTTQNATDLLKLNYDYGTAQNNGNILSQTITVPTIGNNAGFVATQDYSYDPLNRILEATETIGSNQTWKQTFVYDRYGNHTFDEANTTTLTKSCGSSPNFAMCVADKIIENPIVSSATNRIVQDQDNDSVDDYSYDLSGNITKDARGRTFIYDGRNKQAEIKDAQNQTIGQYFYDGNGRRVKKISGAESVIFVYDVFGKLIAEYADQAPANPHVSYITSDNLGTPRIVTDQYGSILARHDYFPFGAEISTTERIQSLDYAPDSLRQAFTGYENDSETDLDFAQARYYSKDFGKFYSVDPFGGSAKKWNPQSINRYAYVLNNPLNLTDPTGLDNDHNKKHGTCGTTTVGGNTEQGATPQPCTNDDGTSPGVIHKIGHGIAKFFRGLGNMISPNVSAQVEDDLIPERSEKEEELKDIKDAFGDPAENEPPPIESLPESLEEEMVNRITLANSLRPLGINPDTLPQVPEPEAFIGPFQTPYTSLDDLILSSAPFSPVRGGSQGNLRGDADQIVINLATRYRVPLEQRSNGDLYFRLGDVYVGRHTSTSRNGDNPPTIDINTGNHIFKIRVRP